MPLSESELASVKAKLVSCFDVLSALGDETRFSIVLTLIDGPCSGRRCLPRRPSFALLGFGADAGSRAGGLRFSAEGRNARLLLFESAVRAGAEVRGLVPHPFGSHSRDSRPRRRRAVRKQGGMLGFCPAH